MPASGGQRTIQAGMRDIGTATTVPLEGIALAFLKQLAFSIAVIIAYKYVKQQQQTLVTLMNKNFISRGNSKTIKTNREG